MTGYFDSMNGVSVMNGDLDDEARLLRPSTMDCEGQLVLSTGIGGTTVLFSGLDMVFGPE